MTIKIHMLNVEDADAIIVQLEKVTNKLTLLVDGGKGQEHANAIIKYLEVLSLAPDLIICSHLDKDHIGGLGYIVARYHREIKSIWVHRPENYDKLLKPKLAIDNLAFSGSERRELVIASLLDLDNFIKVAESYGLKDKIFEPFFNNQCQQMNEICDNWGIRILGPSQDFYQSLLPGFRGFYEAKTPLLAKSTEPCGMIGQEGYDTPENESSLIFQITDDSKNYLFTGDAGLRAFEEIEKRLTEIFWLKVPHHGSGRNLNSEFISKLRPKKCYISANGKQGHPDSNLLECFKRHRVEEISVTSDSGNLVLG